MNLTHKGFRCLSFLLLIHIANTINAQNYLPAAVVFSTGDTVSCFVDYDFWKYCPKEITVKTGLNMPPITYSAVEVKELEVNGEKYFGAIVDVEESHIKLDDLTNESDFLLRTDTVFLKGLILGYKSLFTYFGKDLKENFYIYHSGKYNLLLYKKYLKFLKNTEVNGIGSRTVLTEKKTYLGQLDLYLGDCKSIVTELNTLEYNQEHLERLFRKYYKCTGLKIDFVSQVRQDRNSSPPSNFGIRVGAGIGKLSSFENEAVYFKNATPANKPLISISLCYNHILKKDVRRNSLYSELSFSQFSGGNSYDVITAPDNYSNYYLSYSYEYINLSTYYRHYFSSNSFRPYVFSGPRLGFGPKARAYLREVKYFHSSLITNYETYKKEKRIFDFGMSVGAGFQFNRFTLDLRYELSSGFALDYGPNLYLNSIIYSTAYHF